MYVEGAVVTGPKDVTITQGDPFIGLPERVRTNALVVHETVTRSAEVAYRVLRKRGLSVQLVTDEKGVIIQHADLVARAQHAGARRNGISIGNEVVSPYYPRYRVSPWTTTIAAPWAHEKRYVLPTPESAESCAQWIAWQTSTACPESVRVPRTWVGLADGRIAMGRVSTQTIKGILAHCYFGHADGAWLVLYAWLRIEAGLDPSTAYDEAVRRATGTRRADVRDLVRVA